MTDQEYDQARKLDYTRVEEGKVKGKVNEDAELERYDGDLKQSGRDTDQLKEADELDEAVLESNPFDKNGKLKPNIKYKAGEYEYLYETDEMGRISKFEADDLNLTERESRLAYDPKTPGKKKGDHAGHLAGDRFGGSPEIDNLVSQFSKVNLSKYKKIEYQWAKAIKEGKQVKVNVEIKYDGDSLRPSRFNIKYIIDGKPFSRNLLN